VSRTKLYQYDGYEPADGERLIRLHDGLMGSLGDFWGRSFVDVS
jgi:hypothetical protein